MKIILVVTNYFSKWVKVKAYNEIKQDDLIRFLWTQIICRYGVICTIITYIRTNLYKRKVRIFFEEWKSQLQTLALRHP